MLEGWPSVTYGGLREQSSPGGGHVSRRPSIPCITSFAAQQLAALGGSVRVAREAPSTMSVDWSFSQWLAETFQTRYRGCWNNCRFIITIGPFPHWEYVEGVAMTAQGPREHAWIETGEAIVDPTPGWNDPHPAWRRTYYPLLRIDGKEVARAEDILGVPRNTAYPVSDFLVGPLRKRWTVIYDHHRPKLTALRSSSLAKVAPHPGKQSSDPAIAASVPAADYQRSPQRALFAMSPAVENVPRAATKRAPPRGRV